MQLARFGRKMARGQRRFDDEKAERGFDELEGRAEASGVDEEMEILRMALATIRKQ